jgi:hypothetical protein
VGIIAVYFGAAYTNTFTIVSDSEITVNAPPHTAGAVAVTLCMDVGTTATSAADVYTYTWNAGRRLPGTRAHLAVLAIMSG